MSEHASSNERQADNRLLDIKLLRLFEQLYTTRSVTRAAEKLGQSQPTVSIWLARLRERMDDPLFIRTAEGMLPTPRAEALIDDVRDALNVLRRLSTPDAPFDPATTRHEFRICMTDASHITLLPRILAHLRANAPHCRLEAIRIGAETPHLLLEGEADLALGLIPGLETGFFQQVLYPQDWVCLISRHHPTIRGPLSLQAYAAAEHVEIVSGTGQPLVESALTQAGIDRQIRLRLPGFLGLRAMISTTDLVATVPRHIGETLAQDSDMHVHDCPLAIAQFTVKQHWHERFHRDPANRWLRQLIANLFQRGHPEQSGD